MGNEEKSIELDPKFTEIFNEYVSTGNTTLGNLQRKVEIYIDHRIEQYFKTHFKNKK